MSAAVSGVCLAAGLAFALWLKFRPFRNGSFSVLWGAPTDEELAEAGLPPRDPNWAAKKKPEKRLFGPYPEDEEPGETSS